MSLAVLQLALIERECRLGHYTLSDWTIYKDLFDGMDDADKIRRLAFISAHERISIYLRYVRQGETELKWTDVSYNHYVRELADKPSSIKTIDEVSKATTTSIEFEIQGDNARKRSNLEEAVKFYNKAIEIENDTFGPNNVAIAILRRKIAVIKAIDKKKRIHRDVREFWDFTDLLRSPTNEIEELNGTRLLMARKVFTESTTRTFKEGDKLFFDFDFIGASENYKRVHYGSESTCTGTEVEDDEVVFLRTTNGKRPLGNANEDGSEMEVDTSKKRKVHGDGRGDSQLKIAETNPSPGVIHPLLKMPSEPRETTKASPPAVASLPTPRLPERVQGRPSSKAQMLERVREALEETDLESDTTDRPKIRISASMAPTNKSKTDETTVVNQNNSTEPKDDEELQSSTEASKNNHNETGAENADDSKGSQPKVAAQDKAAAEDDATEDEGKSSADDTIEKKARTEVPETLSNSGNDGNHNHSSDVSVITNSSSKDNRHHDHAVSLKIKSKIVIGIVACILFANFILTTLVVGVAFVAYIEHGDGFLGIQEFVQAHQQEEGNIDKVESFFDVLCEYSPIKISIGK